MLCDFPTAARLRGLGPFGGRPGDCRGIDDRERPSGATQFGGIRRDRFAAGDQPNPGAAPDTQDPLGGGCARPAFRFGLECQRKAPWRLGNFFYECLCGHGPRPHDLYAWHFREMIFPARRTLPVYGYPFEFTVECKDCRIAGDSATTAISPQESCRSHGAACRSPIRAS